MSDEIKNVNQKPTLSFPDRPEIPHVDSHINEGKTDLKLKSMVGYIRQLRVTDYPAKTKYPKYYKFGSSASSIQECSSDGEEVEDKGEIANFLSFCCDGQMYVTLQGVESAFRKCKRLGHEQHDEIARNLMVDMEYYISELNLNPSQWFREMLKSQALQVDGRVTWLEFKFGLRRLCKQSGIPVWSDEKIQALLKFLDPKTCGSIGMTEFKEAFGRIHSPSPHVLAMQDATPKLYHIMNITRQRQIRIKDLFHHLDIEGQNRVSADVFAEGLEQLIVSEKQVDLSAPGYLSSNSVPGQCVKLPEIGSTDTQNQYLIRRLEETKRKDVPASDFDPLATKAIVRSATAKRSPPKPSSTSSSTADTRGSDGGSLLPSSNRGGSEVEYQSITGGPKSRGKLKAKGASAEVDGYDMWTKQFDKRVEIYLKRLARL